MPTNSDRDLVATILSLPPDPDCALLRLDGFLDKADFVGAGRFGDVYEGKWLGTVSEEQKSRLPHLAIKALCAVHLTDEAQIKKRMENLKSDLKRLRSLNHPNVVSWVGFIQLEEDPNRPCLISSVIPNGLVKEYAANCEMKRLRDLMSGIASGLSYLHANNIVHGDVKAKNIEMRSWSYCR